MKQKVKKSIFVFLAIFLLGIYAFNNIGIIAENTEDENLGIYNIRIKYLDEDMNQIKNSVDLSGMQGDTYTSMPVEIDNYYFTRSTDNYTGVFGVNTDEIIHYYKRIEAPYFEVANLKVEAGTNLSEVNTKSLFKTLKGNDDENIEIKLQTALTNLNNKRVQSYSIGFELKGSIYGMTTVGQVPFEIVDTTKPEAFIAPKEISVNSNITSLDADYFIQYVTDNSDGEIKKEILTDLSIVDMTSPGKKLINIKVSDASNNYEIFTVPLFVVDYNAPKATPLSQILFVGQSTSLLNPNLMVKLDTDEPGITKRILTDLSIIDTTKPGSYLVEVEVKNVTGNAAIIYVPVNVVNVTVIEGEEGKTPPTGTVHEKTVEAGSNLLDISVIDLVTDIVSESNPNYSMTIVEDLSTFDNRKIGTININVKLRDGNGNVNILPVPIHIVDTTAPTGIAKDVDVPVGFNLGNIKFENFVETVVENSNSAISTRIVTDLSTLNTNVTGKHEIELELKDDNGNARILKANINVVDKSIPTAEANYAYINVGENLSNLTPIYFVKNVHDDYGVLEIYFITDISLIDKNKTGVHNVIVEIKDESSNKIRVESKLYIIDTISPVAEPNGFSLEVGTDVSEYTPSMFVKNVRDNSLDEISIKFITDIKTVNPYKLGEKRVFIEISDSSGNKNTINSYINFVDTIAPKAKSVNIDIEAGTDLNTLDKNIFASEVSDNSKETDIIIETDLSTINTKEIGTHSINVLIVDKSDNKTKITSHIHIRDTKIPIFQVREINLKVSPNTKKIEALDFVYNITDNSGEEVLVEMLTDTQNIDFQKPQNIDIQIKLTDIYGNSTIVNTKLIITDVNEDKETNVENDTENINTDNQISGNTENINSNSSEVINYNNEKIDLREVYNDIVDTVKNSGLLPQTGEPYFYIKMLLIVFMFIICPGVFLVRKRFKLKK